MLRKTLITVVFAFMLLMLSCAGGPAPETFQVDREVEAWVEFWNTYDLDKIEELFLSGEELTYFSSEKEGLIVGFQAVREHHEGFGFVPGGKQSPNRLWVENLHSVTHASTAVITGTWFFGNQDEAGAKPQRGPFTAVYVWTDEGYRIAHMHFSNY